MKISNLFESADNEGEEWNKPNLIGYENFVYLLPSLEGVERDSVQDRIKKGKYNANKTGISSWKGIPKHCTFDVHVSGNNLKDFEHAPEVIDGDLNIANNLFTSLSGIDKHIKEIHGTLNLFGNNIETAMLGLMNIKGLTKIGFSNQPKIEAIFNKHLPVGDVFDCQDELIDAGFNEYAKL